MRVGLLADGHDRVPAIDELIRMMVDRGVSLLMHAGDYCSPFSLEPLQDSNIPLLGVFGRNDGDHEGLSAYASALGVGAELYESPHSFELAGNSILLVHDIGEVNQRSIEKHQFVIHGCSHQAEMKTRGETMLVNPGEACGWMFGSCTGAILDFKTKEVEFLKL